MVIDPIHIHLDTAFLLLAGHNNHATIAAFSLNNIPSLHVHVESTKLGEVVLLTRAAARNRSLLLQFVYYHV